MKIKFLIILFLICFIPKSFAEDGLRTMFLNNQAIICSINIRNFNANDKNNNGFIDEDEVSGNFINAINRLDEIKSLNINTLHVLPITPVGKLKALGTAGSLYSMSGFNTINDQLVDKASALTPEEQAKLFISECHKRGIKVIIDLPSCGSYDLFLSRPELFIKDRKNMSIVPTDWTDVRLFSTGTNRKLNQDVLDEHKKFIDMVLRLDADGIRADVAIIKPYKFWQELIEYTREKNPQFLFLAEASDSWRETPSKYAEYTPYDKLLEAGFDGYYGSFFNLKDWKTSEQFFEHMKFNKKLLDSYMEMKSVILSFTTHDEVSPIVLYGSNFADLICWLYATLPYNPYFVDGFQYGDNYLYPLANTKASVTETDDDFYFVHRGKLDIFNFSRRPGGNNELIKNSFKRAMEFRAQNIDLVTKGTFNKLKTGRSNIVAYSRKYNDETIVIIFSLDHQKIQKNVKVKVPGIRKNSNITMIKGMRNIKVYRNKLSIDIYPEEIKVLRFKDFTL